jgi:spermidine/putrescine transport system permease protein
LLLTPFGALLAFGVVVPAAMLFAFSFFHLSLLELVPGFTFDNYRKVVSTPLYRTYAVNTFLIAAPTALLSVIGGFVLAYFLAFRARRSRRFLLIAIVIAFMGSYLAVVYSWRTLSGESGIINSLLQAAHVTSAPVGFLLFSRIAVVIAEVNFFLPLTTLVIFSSLSSIPPGLEPASRDLGASAWTTLRRITLPLAGNALFGAALFVFFLSAGDYIAPVFLGGSDRRHVRDVDGSAEPVPNFPLGVSIAFVMLALFAVAWRRCGWPCGRRAAAGAHGMRRRPWILTTVATLLILFIYLRCWSCSRSRSTAGRT